MTRYAALSDRGPRWPNTPISTVLVTYFDEDGWLMGKQIMSVPEFYTRRHSAEEFLATQVGGD